MRFKVVVPDHPMGIERRKSTARYYRSVRNGRQVRKEYIGQLSSPFGELVYRADRLKQAGQASERDVRRAERELAEQEEMVLQPLGQLAQRWRYPSLLPMAIPSTEVGTIRTSAETVHAILESIRTGIGARMTISELKDLLRAVDEGDAAAAAQLKQMVQDEKRLLSEAFDLVAIARGFTIDAIADGSESLKVIVEEQLDEQLRKLKRDDTADGLERMLADVTAVTYLNAMKSHAMAVRNEPTRQGTEYWQTSSNKATTRFHTAVKAFREYRRQLQGE